MHTLSIPCLLVVQIKLWMAKLLEIESILFLGRTKRKAIVTNHSLTQEWDEQQQQQQEAACSTRPRRHRSLPELQSLHSPNHSDPWGQSASVETRQASSKRGNQNLRAPTCTTSGEQQQPRKRSQRQENPEQQRGLHLATATGGWGREGGARRGGGDRAMAWERGSKSKLLRWRMMRSAAIWPVGRQTREC